MAYEYDFQGRMESGRQAAMDRRNKGLPSGKPAAGWSKRKPLPEDTEINRLYVEIKDLRRQLRNALDGNVNPLDNSELEDFGAEFDKLAGRQDWRPAGPIIAGSPEPVRTLGSSTMNAKQYLAALKKLDLTPYSAAPRLGISLRQSHRYASGEQPIKETVALLLAQYLEHGLPESDD